VSLFDKLQASLEENSTNDENLRNLENEQRMPKGFLGLESIPMEGTKALDS
jgi:hypothetical protein